MVSHGLILRMLGKLHNRCIGVIRDRLESTRVYSRCTLFFDPFSVDRQDTDSTEVRLYVSSPDFDGWKLYGSKPLESEDSGKFTYDAGADGIYLFATRTVNQFGKEYPSTPLSCQIRVRVDTQTLFLP